MRRPIQNTRHTGFALVVTLVLMILLTVVAVGLLTLSTISLRSAGQNASTQTARNNARLAMMMAMGELQRALGPDQSVSAPASSVIANPTQPHLTGAWNSWRWIPTSNQTPDYTEKSAKFRRWLISAADDATTRDFSFATKPAPGGIDSVSLVGSRMNSKNISTAVTAAKVTVSRDNKKTGKYAWAVFDESVKAPIHLEDPSPALTATTEAASRTAPNRVRADIVAPALTGLVSPRNMISQNTAVIPSGSGTGEEMRRRFHDFTTETVGLLTDTARGGLKTDLTSIFEDPGATLPGNTLYYAPADGAPSWSYLRDHYRKYKSITSGSTGMPTYKIAATDKAVNPAGLDVSPATQRLLPVIAKCQIVFSIVAHRRYYSVTDPSAGPYVVNGGLDAFATPAIVYEPVFTLHNPYDVVLDLERLRIRIWDPPIKFRFEKMVKTSTGWASFPFRWRDSDRDLGAFYTLAQLSSSANASYMGTGKYMHQLDYARKAFTCILAEGNGSGVGSPQKLVLQPGEVKVFSMRVENDFTWRNNNRPFYDFLAESNVGNVDSRAPGILSAYGVQTVPGWNTRAGLQSQELAGAYVRNPDSYYSFEKDSSGNRLPVVNTGTVHILRTDRVKVQAKPEAPVDRNGNAIPFRIDILAGTDVGSVDHTVEGTNLDQDLLRSFRFIFTNSRIADEISEDPSDPVITQEYLIDDIYMDPDSRGAKDGKKPFAILDVSARTTRDEGTDTKPWLYTNHIVDGALQDHNNAGATHQSYNIRFSELAGSFNSFPGIEIEPITNRGFFGASSSQGEGGSSFVTMAKVPLAPIASLGDMISANVVASSRLPRVVHPLGNSRAHPLLRADRINRSLTGVGTILDHSYLLNDTLWDRYYFSTVADYQEGLFAGSSDARNRLSVLNGIFSGKQAPLNSRITPVIGATQDAAQQINGLTANERAVKLAKYVGIRGAFNLNSTSVDAWYSVLCSLRERAVTGWRNQPQHNTGRTPFPRATLPIAGAAETMDHPTSVLGNNVRWAGYRSLTDAQIKKLAEKIVEEITSRNQQDLAPALTLGEFVNRRLKSTDPLDLLGGVLQSAIDASGVNADNESQDSRLNTASSIKDARKKGVANTTALDGYTGAGAPSSLTQGDLLTGLAPIATVRGDTFKIRCYGEALAADGTTVLATAWCEAVVQRIPDFVDTTNAPETAMNSLNQTNKTFGRRFEIVSFRWLDPKEI